VLRLLLSETVPILITTVVGVALLGLLNLLLTLAVIRRLRGYETRLAAQSRGDSGPDLLPVGTTLPAFSGRTAAGEEVTPAQTELALIAVLSTTCDVCHEQVPELARYLSERGVARDTALVVVVGDVDDPVGQQLADRVDAVATVVREPYDGPVTTALGARIFPAFYLVGDGVVRSHAIAVSELAEPVRA
jgi:hypothetical protein